MRNWQRLWPTNADVVVRHGPARQTLEDFLREVNASALVLGVPHTDLGAQTFASGRAPQFVQEIRSTNGVEVVVVE
jgi:RNase H-fold protein (predicted Holliday junction resolvase)